MWKDWKRFMTSLIWSSCAIGSAMAQDSLVTTECMDMTHSFGERSCVWSAVCGRTLSHIAVGRTRLETHFTIEGDTVSWGN